MYFSWVVVSTVLCSGHGTIPETGSDELIEAANVRDAWNARWRLVKQRYNIDEGPCRTDRIYVELRELEVENPVKEEAVREDDDLDGG